MTGYEKFLSERTKISEALSLSEIKSILYNKDEVPKVLPCAIVILDTETGKNGTSRQYTGTELAWTVYLIVNAQNEDDPDSDLYQLKEKFRSFYVGKMNRDLPSVEYYTSRVDGARLVRIAKIDLLRSGSGAGS